MAFDLGVTRGRARASAISTKEALVRSAFYILLALLFNVGIYFWRGRDRDAALQFLAGYLVEEALSVDNLFVFLLIFAYFRVPVRSQQKVLFWGIIGALTTRAIFIVAGVQLLHRFEWIIFIFGAFLIYTGVKMFFTNEEEIHPERNPVLKLIRRFVPVTADYKGDRFFVKRDGFRLATPLFVVLILVETTDLIFNVDSIPAVLSLTRDPTIAYTSNVFATLGLRALYFALAGMMGLFHHLKYGLGVILAFIGVKMVIHRWYEIEIAVALGVVAGLLGISVATSMIWPVKEGTQTTKTPSPEGDHLSK